MCFNIKFLLFFLILQLNLSIFAQGWVQRNPLKNISEITEIHVSPDQSIFALDVSNTLKNTLVSVDNGLSYRNATSLGARDMHMLNDNLGFLVASNKLIKASNKFETIEQFTLDEFSFSNVFFLNENLGFVSGGFGRIHKTTDGGETWIALTTGTTNAIKDHFFINENIGFACGLNRTFLSTTNGGDTWSEIILPIEDFWDLNKILFVNPNQGILVGKGGHIFNTNDAGVTWTEATSGTTLPINDVKYSNGKYVAVCDNGVVLQSTDLGTTWTYYEINYWRDLYSVAFSNSTIYIGSEGEIFQSTDNGTTWTTHLQGVTMSDLNAVSFANENIGLIVGKGLSGSGVYEDIMFRTTDAGITWEEKTVFGGYYGVHLLANGKALTSRSNINMVGYSSDFGENWSTINGPTITQQFVTKSVWLKSENDFFVGGGNFFGSDGLYRYQTGIGWTSDTSFGNVKYIKFLDDNFGLLGKVNNNTVYKTNDGGNTWSTISYMGPSYDYVNIIDANTFYLGKYLTTDGGNTFEQLNFPGYLFYFKFFTANYALGLSSNGKVYRTIDTGDSWQLINDDFIEDPNCCNRYHISENVMIALSHHSDIFTLDIGQILNTEDFESTKNTFKVYPNPTSDRVFITETNTTPSDVELYNVNGQKIKNYKLSKHQNGLDISDLAQGVYFMHIKSGSQLVAIHRIVKN